jgi:hypothetical protein
MISPNDIQVTKTDLALFSTVLVVSNVVGNQLLKTPLLDEQWKNFAVATLVGVAAHSLLTNKLSGALKDHFKSTDNGVNQSLYDLVKFGTIFASQKLVVAHIQGVQPVFDTKWLMSSGLTIAGYAVFNVVVQSMVPKIDAKMQPLLNDLIKVSMGALAANYFVDGTINNRHLMDLAALLSGFVAFHLLVKQHVVPQEKFGVYGGHSVNALENFDDDEKQDDSYFADDEDRGDY